MIAIIDYGLSNLLSIWRSVKLFSDNVIITNQRADLMCADKIILPGVGAFHYGMDCLKALELEQVIIKRAAAGIPLLGICLGMQMLFEDSEEGGKYQGLGLIRGHVEEIPSSSVNGEKQNVPHIGWNRLYMKNTVLSKSNILKDVSLEHEVYFVHSYEGKPEDINNYVANTVYGGREICAIVQKDNVIGCQFHPEKSGNMGLSLIKNFIMEF